MSDRSAHPPNELTVAATRGRVLAACGTGSTIDVDRHAERVVAVVQGARALHRRELVGRLRP